MQFAVLTLLRRAPILIIVHKVNKFSSQKQGSDRTMSSTLFLTAGIDCGETLEDKDIKGLYPLRAACGLRGGELQVLSTKLTLWLDLNHSIF